MKRLVVLPLKHAAPVTLEETAGLTTELRTQAAKGAAVVDPEASQRLAEAMPESCTTHACMERVASLADAQQLVGGRLQREQSDSWTVQLWVYDRGGQRRTEPLRLATGQRRCRDCSLREVSRLAAELLSSLKDSAHHRGDMASLTVRSRPSGAVVRIDGAPMGVTDMTFGVSAGSHVVTLAKPGFRLAARTVRLAAGGRETITARLEAAERRGGLRAHLGWLKWTCAGAAVASLVPGIALWAAGQQDADPGTGAIEPERRTNYRTPGIALTVAGGVLAAGAVTLFLLDRGDAPRSARGTGVTVVATPQGAAMGYRGRF